MDLDGVVEATPYVIQEESDQDSFAVLYLPGKTVLLRIRVLIFFASFQMNRGKNSGAGLLIGTLRVLPMFDHGRDEKFSFSFTFIFFFFYLRLLKSATSAIYYFTIQLQ